jgi:hypothetical protein
MVIKKKIYNRLGLGDETYKILKISINFNC